MRQKVTAIVMALTLLFALNVSAAPRYNETRTCRAYLSFTGTTANCSIRVKGSSGDAIEATLVLCDKQGNEIMTWSDLSGTSSLSFSGKASVVRGQTYTLTASATVEGESISGNSTLTCP